MKKFNISSDPEIYECHPDLTRVSDGGRLIVVFTERTHHWCDWSESCIVTCISDDHGRSWSKKRPLTERTAGRAYCYDAPRISTLRDGRIIALLTRLPLEGREHAADRYNLSYKISADRGENWSEAVELPIFGIAPDKIIQLENGRIICSVHHYTDDYLTQYLVYSDDNMKSWSSPVTVAKQSHYHLCEGNILQLKENNVLAMFLRENSRKGVDCQLTLSYDNGESWSNIRDFPLPGCHRPVAGYLNDGQIMLLWAMEATSGARTMTMGAFFSERDILSKDNHSGCPRIFPLDYDRSPFHDTGYTGWTQYPDGEIYAVNYIADDAVDCAQIRGYSFFPEEMVLPVKRLYTTKYFHE